MITLTIDPQNHRVLVQGQHLQAHPHPQHRRVEFPAAAKKWIQENNKYNLRNTEQYQRLSHLGYIDPEVHTKEQVYYWVSVFSKETYVMNSGNQLDSTRAFLE